MIDFKQDEGLSFFQMQEKYSLTIGEVMAQYAQYRASIHA